MMLMTVEAEQVLLDRIQGGESIAVHDFVEKYKKLVYFTALDLTGNHHDAEDLSQDVFVKALGAIQGFRGDSKVSSWLHRITVNTYLDQKRKPWFRFLKSDENTDLALQNVVAAGSDPQETLERKRLQEQIDRALGCLSPQQKSVFVLRHYRNMKLKEIADVLEVSEGTVKSVLFRAIRKLQEVLSEYRLRPEKEDAS